MTVARQPRMKPVAVSEYIECLPSEVSSCPFSREYVRACMCAYVGANCIHNLFLSCLLLIASWRYSRTIDCSCYGPGTFYGLSS